MEFAILFIICFLVGFGLYTYLNNWIPAVVIPMLLFVITTVADTAAREAWMFTLLFGLPLVFFASLLGAYVVQIRSADHLEDEQLDQTETETGDKS